MPTKSKSKRITSKAKTAGYKPPMADVWGTQPRDLPLFTFNTIRAMLWDPTIRLGLAMRCAPLHSCEFAYRDGGKWVPGIKADNPQVAEYVLRQLNRIWKNGLSKILKAQIWGWSAGEVLFQVDDGEIQYHRILDRHAIDVRALEKDGELAAVRFRRVSESQPIDLLFPKSFWHSFDAESGSHYGHSILKGAYSPWCDKWLDGGALDVRRLFMHKDAYGGANGYYPPGTTTVPDVNGEPREIPNADIMRQVVEQRKAGAVTTMPSEFDEKGNRRWEIEEAKVASSPTHILEFPKDLDTEMLRGLEIPDDVLESGVTGAWAGKAVPQQAFYTGLDVWLNSVVGDVVVPQIIEHLVMLRFGRAENFDVCTKPLALQNSEQEEGGQPMPPPKGSNPFTPNYGSPKRMALEAIGNGTLSAMQLVKATKIAMRKRRKREPVS